ncbi:MAG: SH3 domain-containing protein [Anaerolineae bacterium]|nr:SH3 domain-containing protein [Anaerolineae bacterium]
MGRKLAAIVVSAGLVVMSACTLSTERARPSEEAIPRDGNAVAGSATATSEFVAGSQMAALDIVTSVPTVTGGAAVQQVSENAAGANTAPVGVCAAKPSGSFDVNIRSGPGTTYTIVGVLQATTYARVSARDTANWLRVDTGNAGSGWVSGAVVTLAGPCGVLPVEVFATATNTPLPLAATPVARFGSVIGLNELRLVTTEAIGAMSAGTAVWVSAGMYDGREWIYDVMSADGVFVQARESQLRYGAGQTGELSTPTPPPQATCVIDVDSLSGGCAGSVGTPSATSQP